MVLSKRNAKGEFVAWNSSQGSSSTSSRVPVVDPYSSMSSKSPSPAKTRHDPPLTEKASYPVPHVSKAPVAPKIPAPSAAKVSVPTLSAPPIASSSIYQPGSSQPSISAPAKRGRKRKADSELDGAPPEKRGARFKASCPKNILERLQRVTEQRIFMIDRNRIEGQLKEEFSVLGSTGNVYVVTIDHNPRCTCPDHLKGNHCKHILFIFSKVLQVSIDSHYWYQKALLTSELERVFAEAPLAPNSLAHPHIREAYARATGKASSVKTAAPSKKRVPGPEDECPVCYDGMHGVADANLSYCEECGNALHKECFAQWQRTAASSGKDLTCVWCRARWVLAPAGGAAARAAGARMGSEGYMNFAGTAGVSPERDTSTYYHGPRRGQRYRGYQDYGF